MRPSCPEGSADAGWHGLLDADATHHLLQRCGIPVPRQILVDSPEAAATASRGLRRPVVLKAQAPGLVHKSDAGGVRLGLRVPAEVAAAARQMASRIPTLRGYLVQETAPTGLEMFVGLKHDPTFGPVVLLGLGGVWVEVFDDVVLRLAPVTAEEAIAMLGELRAAPRLIGPRQVPPLDFQALAALVARVSSLPESEPGIMELDLNPIVVHPRGVLAVDARVVCDGAVSLPRSGLRAGRGAVAHILNPRSIAVVGASTSREKQGGRLFHYLVKHGFPGTLYAVNPHATTVMGRLSVRTVADLPEVPDLACIAVPADAVADVLTACGRKGIPAATVYTAGFAEAGEGGRRRQAELVEVARRHGIRLCGPNTAGVVNTVWSMCAAFGMAFEVDSMPRGEIAFLTQSGALGSSLLSRSWAQGIGFSAWICSGNEADLTLSDYLLHLVEAPSTRVVAVFLESIRDPRGFREACQRARAVGKPIVVYKTGASEVGQRAVWSHTGSLAGADAVYDAVFRADGVVRARDLQGLVDAAVALAWQPLPAGRRVGVVSASGGACSVIADECARRGLELPPLPAATVERIARVIPSFGVAQNPIDVTMEITVRPEMVGRVAEILLDEPCIDALVVLLTTNADPPALEVAKGVAGAAQGARKPVLVTRVGAEFLAPASIAYYQAARIPLYPMPDRTVSALRAMVDVSAGRARGTG